MFKLMVTIASSILFMLNFSVKPMVSRKIEQDTAYVSLSSFQRDTSKYLIDNFVSKQTSYNNRKLAVLLSRLELPILYYAPVSGGNKEGEVAKQNIAIYLKFSNATSSFVKLKKHIVPNILVIYFKNFIPVETSDSFLKKYKFDMQFSNEVKRYYSDQVVDHIDYIHVKAGN